jgi:hypothetical protein
LAAFGALNKFYIAYATYSIIHDEV